MNKILLSALLSLSSCALMASATDNALVVLRTGATSVGTAGMYLTLGIGTLLTSPDQAPALLPASFALASAAYDYKKGGLRECLRTARDVAATAMVANVALSVLSKETPSSREIATAMLLGYAGRGLSKSFSKSISKLDVVLMSYFFPVAPDPVPAG